MYAVFFLILWLCLPCATDAQTDSPPSYRIGRGDVLFIEVWSDPSLGGERVVRPDGKIVVPLLGDIQAAGRTLEELGELLTARLADYLTDSRAFVHIRHFGSWRIYVLGEVQRPGIYTMPGGATILDALAQTGGPTLKARRHDVRILRPNSDGTMEEISLNLDKYLNRKIPITPFPLQRNDVIVVPQRSGSRVADFFAEWQSLLNVITTAILIGTFIKR